MRILVDTDILIDVALDRLPHSEHSSQPLDQLQSNEAEGFIAWHSISNLYYICTSGTAENKIRGFVDDITDFLEVAETDTESVKQALALNIGDFEDALQIAAAMACQASIIATRSTKHYKCSPIKAFSPEDILKRFLA